MYEKEERPLHDHTLNSHQNSKELHKSSGSYKEAQSNGKDGISAPAIAAIVVFSVVVISAVCMFFFYRRRRTKDEQQSSSQVVKLTPVSPQTSTIRLTSQTNSRPIPAAPDYNALGIGRRFSREMLNDSTSSEEDQYYDADDVLQKYDWSSSQKRKRKSQGKVVEEDESTMSVDALSVDRVDAPVNQYEENIDFPPYHLGRIWFRVDYQSASEKLEVTIVKVRNLPLRENSTSPPDPLVRLYLLPDDRCEHQTEVKVKTRNPNFGSSFVFQIARDDLRQRVLRLSVYDQWKGRRGDVIGHVLYLLKDPVFGVDTWRDLETLSEVESKLGDLHVSLAHYPVLDRLTVIVLRATNLPRLKGKNDPDTYVKVTFSKGNNVLKVKKTGVKCSTTEPFFNESFNISATMDDLPSCSLLLSVHQKTGNIDEGQDGKLIGRVLLGGMMYARGKELEHWTDMICQPRTMVKYWHSLSR